MAELPRPDVQVVTRQTEVAQECDIVISRDGKAKTYVGSDATSRDGAVKEAVEKIIGDGQTAEWLPGKK